MVFNSITYAAFLVAVVALYHGVLHSVRSRNALLFVAGSVFYASWQPPFLLLLYATIAVDYAVGRLLVSHERHRKAILLASLALNLGVLFGFKYLGFVLDNVGALAALLGHPLDLPHLEIELPLGISFYTFLSLSYTIDVYRRVCAPEPSLLRYGVFVTFFPHLIAGPILRAAEFLPQVRAPERGNLRPVPGINRILVGLIKKCLLADWLSLLTDPVFADPAAHDGVACAVAVFAYAFQIYFDFSGYIDIAVGSAHLLGYSMPPNFDRPYLSTSITDFWRRWHMTLSRWLRDYVYIPMGGNRRGRVRTYLHLSATMLIGGLWHGPSWNFVIWGGLHGAYLAVHKAWLERRGEAVRLRPLRIYATFLLVCLAWIFFRAQTLDGALAVIDQILDVPFQNLSAGRLLLGAAVGPALLVGYGGLTALRRRAVDLEPRTPLAAMAYGFVVALVVAALAAAAAPGAQFIYFVF